MWGTFFRRPTRVEVALAALALGLGVVGAWLPNLLVWLLGIAALLAAVARCCRGRRTLAAAVAAVLVLGVALPWALGRYLTNADVDWRADGASAAQIVGPTTYLFPGTWDDASIQAVSTRTGESLWSAPGNQAAITPDGEVLVTDDRADWALYGADGEPLWTHVPDADYPALWPVARVDGMTVLLACDDLIDDGEPGDCVALGVDDAGRRVWSRELEGITFSQFQTLLPDPVATTASTVVFRQDVAGEFYSKTTSRLIVLDPQTGRTTFSGPVTRSDLPGAVIPTETGFAAARGCGFVGYEVSGGTAVKRWSTRFDQFCDGATVWAFDVLRTHADRAYLDVGGSVVTLDLATGESRVVEDTDPANTAMLGDTVVVTRWAGALTAVDAATGEQLWERELPGEVGDDDILVDDAVLVREPARTLNPLLNPGFRMRERSVDFDDVAARWVVLDARTGRERASYVDRYGLVEGGVTTAEGRAVITHSFGRGTVGFGD